LTIIIANKVEQLRPRTTHRFKTIAV